MKDIYYVYFVFSFIYIEKIVYSVGDCPEYCNATQTCPESDCPYGGCYKGFWGRRCQYPLECLLPGDNGVYYRGTKNVTKGGRSCIKWNAYHNFLKLPDGPDHNYCRNGDNHPNTWCYVSESSENGRDRWGNCEVPSCDDQCPAPNLQPHSVLTTKASNGFNVGLSITVKCDVGYVQQQDCKPLECLIPGDNGVHYRGTKNVTSDGTPCIKWNAVTYSYKPPDGPYHNYCRHVIYDDTPNTWCYNSKVLATQRRWGECNISLCDREFLAAIDTGSCQKGFYLQHVSLAAIDTGPHVSVECLQDRTWSKPFPTCVDIQCSINTLPDYSEVNGTATKTAFQVGEKIPIKCRTGYQLSGSNKIKCSKNSNWIPSDPCTDIDECIRTPCQRYATCMNTQGSYNCTCIQGYYNDIPGQCSDIDECIRTPCQRYATCMNTQGSYNCTCIQGYYNDIPGQCSARCSKPSVNLHSSIVNGREVYKLNESLEVICDEGYETSDNRYFTCVEDARWNGMFPTCKENPQTPNENDESSEPSVSALGGGIGAVVAVIIIIIIVIIVVFRRRRNEQKEDGSMSVNSPMANLEMNLHSDSRLSNSRPRIYENSMEDDEKYYEINPIPSSTNTSVRVEDFDAYVSRRLADKESLVAEYKKLKTDFLRPVRNAEKAENQPKNNHSNVYPYDDNRVTLRALPNHPWSDYYNASFINGHASLKRCIAAQAPFKATLNDFWRMVWESKVKRIVMFTSEDEERQGLCTKYWPAVGSRKFGYCVVTLTEEDIFPDYAIRELSVTKNQEKRTITHYHFTAWSEWGVPENTSTILNLRELVFRDVTSNEEPIVVHCRTGIGRTGTFIALDYLMDQAKSMKYIDVFECAEDLGRQRVNMIQTKKQYIYLHVILRDALVGTSDEIEDNSESCYQALLQRENISPLYSTLQETTPI